MESSREHAPQPAFTELCRLGAAPQADLIVSMLRGNGVEACLKNEYGRASATFILPARLGGISVMVPTDQLSLAQTLLDQADPGEDDGETHESPTEGEQLAQVCPQCGGADTTGLMPVWAFAAVVVLVVLGCFWWGGTVLLLPVAVLTWPLLGRRRCRRCGHRWREPGDHPA